MRIIAGSLGGRRIKSPTTNDIRPTSDKVKEAIFSMILPYTTGEFTAVDLFAGSGNMGIEAISRGATKVFFTDASRQSLNLVRENLKLCDVEDKAVLISGDFRNNIRRIKDTVDIYFVDPPYADGYIPPALWAINEAGNLRPGGIVVCEHSKKDVLDDEYPGFKKLKDRRYGAIAVTIYEKTAPESADDSAKEGAEESKEAEV